MEIGRDKKKGRICLTQVAYLKKVLQRFHVSMNTKPVSVPLGAHLKLSASLSSKLVEDRELMSKTPYASTVRSLMYAMVCTRPDLSQAVSMVLRYMHDPGVGHSDAVRWILRCIRGTLNVGSL